MQIVAIFLERVTPIQEVNPITIIIFQIDGVKKAITARIRKKVGIDNMISTKRMIIESI